MVAKYISSSLILFKLPIKRDLLMSGKIDKNKLVEKLANKLLMLRDKLKFNQEEFDKKVGVSRKTLLEVKNGRRAM